MGKLNGLGKMAVRARLTEAITARKTRFAGDILAIDKSAYLQHRDGRSRTTFTHAVRSEL
jgi:hypothetical protein